MKSFIENLVRFVKETRAEAKKVIWPERRYVMVATIVILIMVFITCFYVIGIDFVLGKFFAVFIK